MKSTHEGIIPIPGLPLSACKCQLFKELGKTSLISMGILVNHGCKIHLEEDNAIVTLEDYVIILNGSMNAQTRGLWLMNLPRTHTAYRAVGDSANPRDLLAFEHAALFSPTLLTLNKALTKGFVPPIPRQGTS
jgi:hypothetical protein